MEEAEKFPHPREPLSGTPTAQNGGWEMIYSSMGPLHCPGVRLMHTSKIREKKSDLLDHMPVKMGKRSDGLN